MDAERRINRSKNAYEALELQLFASLKRANFGAVILAESQGFPIAGVGNVAGVEEVAAMAPSLMSTGRCWQGIVELEKGLQQKVTIASLPTEGGDLYLCGVGGDSLIAAAELEYSCRGVHRIFV